MALHFKRSDALLLLVPKTGSTWIRAKVKELGLEVEEVGDPAMREHDQLAAFDRKKFRYVGAFVRNPIDWYRSYWAYRMERGWRPAYALDRECASDDFETFVRRAVSILPGALANIYGSYIGSAARPVDFIGRQEQLEGDFGGFLALIGEPLDPAALERGARVNATRLRPDFPEELKELITVSEWETMQRLGYLEGRPDPIGLAEIEERYPASAHELRLLALWTERIHWAPDDRKEWPNREARAMTRHARIHSNFALFAEHKRGDLDYAEERYRRALALDPNHPRTLTNYALFLWKHRGDPDQARNLMLRALTRRPDHPYTLSKLARLTDQVQDDSPLAEVLYRQSLAGNDDQAEVRVELAQLLAREGRASDAVELLRPPAERPDADRLTLAGFALVLGQVDRDAEEARHYELRAKVPAEMVMHPVSEAI
jgi:Tfp pilus assembly protein PilF